MENNEEVKNEEVKEEVVKEETVEELKQRLENAKAENARKAQELHRVREELDARSSVNKETVFNPQDITTWKDHELKAVLKDPQYAAIHDQATELLDRRRFQRFQAEREESTLRMKAELDRKKNFPDTLNPTHPMAIRMEEVMQEHRLERTPAGKLAAAKIAHLEMEHAKNLEAGRKAAEEKARQEALKSNVTGGGRPAPKISDVKKMEELKKRAQAGDETARAEWFQLKGLI
jgi:hypothetical protein